MRAQLTSKTLNPVPFLLSVIKMTVTCQKQLAITFSNESKLGGIMAMGSVIF